MISCRATPMTWKRPEPLLAEAGVAAGQKLLLTYTAGNETEKSTAELYKSELAKLSIDLEIRSMPWDSQWELAKNPDPAQPPGYLRDVLVA